MKYRKKPIEVEAFRLGFDHIPDWFMDCVTKNSIILRGDYKGETSADIETLEGVIHANYGDFIIKGIKGEIYPCKPDIFEKTYEPATNTHFDRIRAMSVEEMAEFLFTRLETDVYLNLWIDDNQMLDVNDVKQYLESEVQEDEI